MISKSLAAAMAYARSLRPPAQPSMMSSWLCRKCGQPMERILLGQDTGGMCFICRPCLTILGEPDV